MQLVFVATEVSPWSKVGGLGDVLSALPLELASRCVPQCVRIYYHSTASNLLPFHKLVVPWSESCLSIGSHFVLLAGRGHAVMTVTPRYKAYADVANTGLRVPVNLPSKTEESSKRQQSYDSSDSAQQNVISSQACSDGQAHARLFHQKADGVDRVFVDHPLFLNPHADLTHSNRNSSVRTYLEAADAPDLDLQYSILCQAALAAPILLWHQPQRHLASLQQQALLRSHPLTLSGGLVQHVNVDKSRISVAQAVPKHVARKLGTVVEHDRAVQPHTLRGGVAHTTAVSNHVAGQQSTRQADQQMKQWLEAGDQRDPGMYDVVWPETIGKIGFIGNDWPCAPLSLHLSCLQASCHEKLEAETIPQTVGEPNEANNMTPDNTFQTQLARLLKSARVAFCIHNMAYQGIFPQVCSSTWQRLQHYSTEPATWSC